MKRIIRKLKYLVVLAVAVPATWILYQRIKRNLRNDLWRDL